MLKILNTLSQFNFTPFFFFFNIYKHSKHNLVKINNICIRVGVKQAYEMRLIRSMAYDFETKEAAEG